jgi:hypothetical protein
MKSEVAESPIVTAFRKLQAMDSKWSAEVGRRTGDRWIRGDELRQAEGGGFYEFLLHLGRKIHTSDRRNIAASFALRFGWSSVVAIAPYVIHGCVPRVTLDNISFRFSESCLFEKAALHHAEGASCDAGTLLLFLRKNLVEQARPIVETLHRWSGFSVKGLWGMITPGWGSQCINVCGATGDRSAGVELARRLCAGTDVVARMQAEFFPIVHEGTTHYFSRRASCCRYYLQPNAEYCASCPLESHEVRIRKNTEWLKSRHHTE